MKRNIMRKNLRQSIFKSLGRYLAIVAIIGLGAGIFVGLRASKRDMIATGRKFMDELNMFDLRLLSSYGWAPEHVEQISRMEGVEQAEGVMSMDVIIQKDGNESEQVFRFYNLPREITRVDLRGGRMPESPHECLADGYQADDSILGQKIHVTNNNTDGTLEALQYDTYTVVGYVASPLYMDMNRGNTAIGNGSLASYLYIPEAGFATDYYTEIDITIPGDFVVYTDEFDSAMEKTAEVLEPLLQPLADQRLEQVRTEAEAAYADGLQDYRDGQKELEKGKKESHQQLSDAFSELQIGEQELRDNEMKIALGEQKLAEARETMRKTQETLRQSEVSLANAKASAYSQLASANDTLMKNYREVSANLQQVNSGIVQIDAGLAELNAGITQLEAGITQLDTGIKQIDLLINTLDTGIRTAKVALGLAQNNPSVSAETIEQLEAQIAESEAKRDEYVQQREELELQRQELTEQLDSLLATKAETEAKREELVEAGALLEDALRKIDDGFLELQSTQTMTDNQFAVAEAQLQSGKVQLEAGMEELEMQAEELQSGKQQLDEGAVQLEEGWKEFRKGRKEAYSRIRDGEKELADAALKLEDANAAIADMTEAKVFVLDRNSNMGYQSLYRNADIVAGVSKVFPVFFLLIAALVCITTMTRMINEERTQIGTLKALGYSNGAIIGKYLMYAGSGAILGCGMGVLLGSIVFPVVLWKAYCIMLYITPKVEILFDWLLCIAVVLTYTAVMLLVTWYCCRRELAEVPAELIRPKAPAAGKSLILERFKIWQRVSFLNKVTIRNIFRYHQRLAMMLVGIGGCTALLVTGFGLRDSIVNIVDYQYEDITSYDMQVYFSQGQTTEEQELFAENLEKDISGVMFFHQTSVEAKSGHKSRDVQLLAAEDEIRNFISLHRKTAELPMPGENEVLLSVGVAEALGLKAGDTLELQNPDMETLQVTVSGIFDNYVYNYAITSPETIENQWGKVPEKQMAYVSVEEGQDVHSVGARIADGNNIMNVTINQDIADMVDSMMDALDLVVITVVICAGLLAIIVLYNLTNININERIREIATIKVLGFNATETAAYVFKENLALTIMGTVIGLPFGRLLLGFVMDQIKIDMVWFPARITPLSNLLALVLTLLATAVVIWIFYYRLEKIDMAEALKSVE